MERPGDGCWHSDLKLFCSCVVVARLCHGRGLVVVGVVSRPWVGRGSPLGPSSGVVDYQSAASTGNVWSSPPSRLRGVEHDVWVYRRSRPMDGGGLSSLAVVPFVTWFSCTSPRSILCGPVLTAVALQFFCVSSCRAGLMEADRSAKAPCVHTLLMHRQATLHEF